MKGTLVNTAAILAGSAVGLLLKRGIGRNYQQIVIQGVSLAVLAMGIQMAMKTNNILIVILSLAIGGIVGEALAINDKLNRVGEWLTTQFGSTHGNAGQGFVTASLLFCIGAMAIVGPLQDGLTGDASTLYAKAMIDGIMSIVLAAAMGIGVALSAVAVLLFQGTVTVLAGLISTVIQEPVIKEMTAVGGILITGVAILMLEIAKIRIANLLPAIPVAAVIAILWPA